MYFKRILCLIFFLEIIFGESLHQRQKELYFLQGQMQEIEDNILQNQIQNQKSGLLLGGGIGSMLFTSQNQNSYPIAIDLRIGYQHFFENTTAGIKFYLDAVNSIAMKNNRLINFILPSINLDLVGDIMLDKSKKYGLSFSGGVALGGLFSITKKDNLINPLFRPSQWSLLFNLGFGVIFNLKHRIELQMKIPSSNLYLSPFIGFKNIYLIVYQYNF